MVSEPYYTLIEISRTAAGALGSFASIIGGMAAIVGNGVLGPLLGAALVCILFFSLGELTLVRSGSLRGRLHGPGSDISVVACRISGHAYKPQGVTTEDRPGISSQTQSPHMIWKCARCCDEQWLTPGISPP